MRARGILPIILANVIVSALVAFGIIALLSDRGGDDDAASTGNTDVITVVFVTREVVTVVVTPTPPPDQVDLNPDALAGAGLDAASPVPGATNAPDSAPQPTVAAGLFDAQGNFIGGADDLPPGCFYHTLVDGENPSAVAVQYEGVDLNTLLAVNNLDEESALLLQIGEQLIVPGEGCPVEQFIQAQPDVTPTEALTATPAPDEVTEGAATLDPAGLTPTLTPTITLVPTAVDARLAITDVIGAGDITRETLVVENRGEASVDIGGWTVSDLDGNTFTFPDRRVFGLGVITLSTRAGEGSSVEYFWGQDSAIFQPGDVLTLRDDNGTVQSTWRIGEAP